jgi:hypothetical protein
MHHVITTLELLADIVERETKGKNCNHKQGACYCGDRQILDDAREIIRRYDQANRGLSLRDALTPRNEL